LTVHSDCLQTDWFTFVQFNVDTVTKQDALTESGKFKGPETSGLSLLLMKKLCTLHFITVCTVKQLIGTVINM